jgi:hypothetical protein
MMLSSYARIHYDPKSTQNQNNDGKKFRGAGAEQGSDAGNRMYSCNRRSASRAAKTVGKHERESYLLGKSCGWCRHVTRHDQYCNQRLKSLISIGDGRHGRASSRVPFVQEECPMRLSSCPHSNVLRCYTITVTVLHPIAVLSVSAGVRHLAVVTRGREEGSVDGSALS